MKLDFLFDKYVCVSVPELEILVRDTYTLEIGRRKFSTQLSSQQWAL